MPLFNLFFFGLGWPWAGDFVGFLLALIFFFQPKLIWQIGEDPIVRNRFACSWPLKRTFHETGAEISAVNTTDRAIGTTT